jgi:hypothetical protein
MRAKKGGVIVRGRIELTVGGESRVLGPGDAYYFKSTLPHRFRNHRPRGMRNRQRDLATDTLIQLLIVQAPYG